MPKLKDLRGKIFGELIVLNENPIRINNAHIGNVNVIVVQKKIFLLEI